MLELRVDLSPEADEDAAQPDDTTRQLRREALELEVDDVRRVADGSPPPGARAVDAALLGNRRTLVESFLARHPAEA
jgi:hypothetical protein